MYNFTAIIIYQVQILWIQLPTYPTYKDNLITNPIVFNIIIKITTKESINENLTIAINITNGFEEKNVLQ